MDTGFDQPVLHGCRGDSALAIVSEKNADLRVAIRRTIRVGPEAGTELEDLSVTPDERHEVTRDDLMKDNVDLIKHAAALLLQKPVFDFQATPTRIGENVRIDLVTQGVDYVDAFSDGRPRQSRDTENYTVSVEFRGRCRSEDRASRLRRRPPRVLSSHPRLKFCLNFFDPGL